MVLGTRMRKSQGGAKISGRKSGDKYLSNENDKIFGRESNNGKGRNFGRGGDNSGKRSPRSYRGDTKLNENGYDKRSESRYSITKRNSEKHRGDDGFKNDRRKPYYGAEQNFSRGGYDGCKSNTRDPRSFRGRRGVIIPNRSPVIDQLMSKGKSRKRKDTDGNNLEEHIIDRPMRIMRRDRVSKDKKEENDESSDVVEASSGKLRLKWKKMDKKQKDSDGDGNEQDKGDILKKNTKNNDGSDRSVEDKPIVHRTRILNKFGKKIRVVKTSLKDGTETTIVPVKKKKRAIKLDPYDLSNKRLDDAAPVNANGEDKDADKISMNAQFRAIQPSPSILSFVEDNLLGRRRLTELKDAGYNVKLSAPLDNIPFSSNIERERIEENVFRSKLEFFAAAKISSSFPPSVVPEIAFAGRSNVGKSSLLNALTRQWGVVRTSDKPGLTQTINFFDLDKKLTLVDLPGYGFAYAKEEVKEAWEELVKEYVSTRVGLQRVCLLIDTKWGMKARDHELIDLMESSKTPYQIVLTKTDLVFPIDVARRAMQIQENLKRNKSIINPLAMVSSKSGAGVRNLRSILAKITRFVKP